MAYIRKPLEFKQYPTLTVKIYKSSTATTLPPTPTEQNIKEAQSRIAMVLMTSNGLKPAQKQSLMEAKGLLNA